jgi:hypothetical protein
MERPSIDNVEVYNGRNWKAMYRGFFRSPSTSVLSSSAPAAVSPSTIMGSFFTSTSFSSFSEMLGLSVSEVLDSLSVSTRAKFWNMEMKRACKQKNLTYNIVQDVVKVLLHNLHNSHSKFIYFHTPGFFVFWI